MFSEKDMEDAIVAEPEFFLKRGGLELLSRQYVIGNFRFDLLFRDRLGRVIIVEIQKGTLDRNHSFKIVDYYNRYQNEHPDEKVEVVVVANEIPVDRKQFFDKFQICYSEVSDGNIVNWKSSNKLMNGKNEDLKAKPEKIQKERIIIGPNPLRQQLLDEASKRIPVFRGRKVDITKNNINAPAGSGNQWVIVARNEDCRVELAFKQDNTAKKYFLKMQEHKASIEKEFGERLFWDYSEGRKHQYIKTIDQNYSEISVKLEEVIKFLVERMERFISVIGKYWDKVR